MRVFDGFEREVLKTIKQFSDNGLEIRFISLMDNYLEHKGIRIDYTRNKAYLLFDSVKFGRMQPDPKASQPDLGIEVKSFLNSFFKIILLTTYLEKEGYAFRTGSGMSGESLATYAKTNDIAPLIREITDLNALRLLSEYFHSIFYMSQGLLDHIRTGFLSIKNDDVSDQVRLLEENLNLTREILSESKKYISTIEKNLEESQVLIEDGLYMSQKSMRYSDIALGVAILLGVIGTTLVGISTYLTFNELDKNTRKLSGKLDPISTRIEAIEQNFTYISEKLDNIKIKDTIHTKLVHFPNDTVYTKVVNHIKVEDITEEVTKNRQRKKRKISSN